MRGRGKKLIIIRNSMVKKQKFESVDQNSCYIPQEKANNIYNTNRVI